MNSVWKWVGIAACGLGLLVAVDRINTVTAADDRPSYGRSGDIGEKIDRLADKLDRLLERMEHRRGPGGPPPHGDRDHAGPPRERPDHHEHRHHGRPDWGGPPRGPHHELPPEVRERMQQARAEMKERMEKARERFQELEVRVQSLEDEVEQLKAGRQG